jgi:hypothetical protein
MRCERREMDFMGVIIGVRGSQRTRRNLRPTCGIFGNPV